MNLSLSFIAIAEAAAKQQAQQLKPAENFEKQQEPEQAEGGNGEDRGMKRDSLPTPRLYSCSVTPLSCIDGTDAIAV
jgi:hypothetical protein